uniref:NAC-A/B domain-containing protein n=1 Tax=Apteryx owenii TaxID=8824 RepID=A0A8B9S6F6_APTOW
IQETIILHQEKLAKLQGYHCEQDCQRPATADDKKLQFSLKKLEIKNYFWYQRGNIYKPRKCQHFSNFRTEVQVSLTANAFAFSSHAETKHLKGLTGLAEVLPRQHCEWGSTSEHDSGEVLKPVENFNQKALKNEKI